MFPCTFQSDATTLVEQAAEQNKDIVIQDIDTSLEITFSNDSYVGVHIFGSDDISYVLFGNIGQSLGKWISEGKEFLAALMALIVFMPNRLTSCRSLRSSGLRLILFMTLIGIAFANLTG